MASGDQTHPSAKQLADFNQGSLPPSAAESVASHIQTCTQCQQHVSGAKRSSSHSRPPSPSSRTELPPELQALGKFEVLGKLGEGGMGAVWKAKHTFLDRLVAVKVMSNATVGNAEARDRFLTEMRAGGKLNHPNIAQTIDAAQEGDALFMVMEYVEGITLERLVTQKGPLPYALACRFVTQAALALQHAHERGMVHRDVKPANMMVTGEKQVKVLDFGLAQVPAENQADRKTQFKMFMGTPDFVAPEQATDARSVDIRGDIYSLGCTLYFLLSGKPPFTGKSHFDVASKHITDEPEPLEDVPADLWDVIATMMAKRREDRYQTPNEVITALAPFTTRKDAAGGKPTMGVSPAPKTPTRRPRGHDSTIEVVEALGPETTRKGATGVKPAKELPRPRKMPPASHRKHALLMVIAGAGLCVPALAVFLVLFGWSNKPTEPSGRQVGDGELIVAKEQTTQPTARSSRDAVVARKVLELRGAVTVFHTNSGVEREVKTPADLPAEDYSLVGIRLAGNENLSDGLVSQFSGLARLATLDLTTWGANGSLSDAGLAHFGNLTSLKILKLGGLRANITDVGLSHLSELVNLEYLGLGGTKVTSEGMRHLGGMIKLKTLYLSHLRGVGDDGLVDLVRLPNLHTIWLDNTGVSDHGIHHLARMSALQEVKLDGSSVTAEGVRRLKSALPDCRVEWRQPARQERPGTDTQRIQTRTYTFSTRDSLDDLIAADKQHRVRPGGGLELLRVKTDPKFIHREIRTKTTFTFPIEAGFEVESFQDANFDVTVGLFGKMLFRWGIFGNTRTLVEVEGETPAEIPHSRIVAGKRQRVTMSIDSNRSLEIKIDGKRVYHKALRASLYLGGPVVLSGGGYGHYVIHSLTVKAKQRD